MAPAVIFEGSNVNSLKVYEAEDLFSGLHFIPNLLEDGSVYFKVFTSRHSDETYSPPPTLQFTANSTDGPAAAVDVKAFHSFFKENAGLLRGIQKAVRSNIMN